MPNSTDSMDSFQHAISTVDDPYNLQPQFDFDLQQESSSSDNEEAYVGEDGTDRKQQSEEPMSQAPDVMERGD